MIKIICVGKIKEKFYRDAIDEYVKRLSKYTKLEITQVMDEPNIEKSLKVEEARINKHIKENDYVITMEIEGKQLSSLEFASKISNTFISYPNIVFVIGGSYGLSPEIKKRSNFALSFSKMTFPHQMFRVVLLEQIYRVFKINNNENYHK